MLKRLYKKVEEWFCTAEESTPRWTKEKFMAELDATKGQKIDFSPRCGSGELPLEPAIRLWPSTSTKEELEWYIEWLGKPDIKDAEYREFEQLPACKESFIYNEDQPKTIPDASDDAIQDVKNWIDIDEETRKEIYDCGNNPIYHSKLIDGTLNMSKIDKPVEERITSDECGVQQNSMWDDIFGGNVYIYGDGGTGNIPPETHIRLFPEHYTQEQLVEYIKLLNKTESDTIDDSEYDFEWYKSKGDSAGSCKYFDHT